MLSAREIIGVAVAVLGTVLCASAGTAQTSVVSHGRPAWAAPDVPQAVWSAAEAARAAPDGDEARRLAREAEHVARQALAGDTGSVGLRFALAVAMGIRLEHEGVRAKVATATEFHRELTAILARDAQHAGAHHLLGRLHAGVQRMNRITRFAATRLLGGAVLSQSSWADAERHLAFAEAEAPGLPEHHLELARLYQSTRRPELALREVEHVLAMEPASAGEVATQVEASRTRAQLVSGR